MVFSALLETGLRSMLAICNLQFYFFFLSATFHDGSYNVRRGNYDCTTDIKVPVVEWFKKLRAKTNKILIYEFPRR